MLTTPPAIVAPTYAALGPPSQFIESEPTNGFVACELDVDDVMQLTLVTRVHESWADNSIAAFVGSDASDPDASNNCRSAQATVPAEADAAYEGVTR